METLNKNELNGTVGYINYTLNFEQDGHGTGYSCRHIQNHSKLIAFVSEYFGEGNIPEKFTVYQTVTGGFTMNHDEKVGDAEFDYDSVEWGDVETFEQFVKIYESMQLIYNVFYTDSPEFIWDYYFDLLDEN